MNYFHFFADRPLVTVFPSKELVVDGKVCVPGGRTFFFDLESYENCDIRNFGEVYAANDNLKEVVASFGNDSICDEFSSRLKRIEAYLKIYYGVDRAVVLKDTPIRGEILAYYGAFNKLLDKIFRRSQKQNYKFMRETRRFIETIAQRSLNIDRSNLKPGDYPVNKIVYNMYKSSTGRFITKPNSFPILNIAREKRGIIRPTNRIFAMIDQRAADFRTFLYVFADDRRPYEDVADLYEGVAGDSRDDKKKNVFRQIYGKNSEGMLAEFDVFRKIYNMIFKETDDSLILLSPMFKRELVIKKNEENIDNLLISHLIQSLTSDVTLDACFKIEEVLKNTQSFIAFTIHDAIVLDLTIDDYYNHFADIKKVVEDTRLGRYFWKSYLGYNFGDMQNESDFNWNSLR